MFVQIYVSRWYTHVPCSTAAVAAASSHALISQADSILRPKLVCQVTWKKITR